jgi:hypothetical protein
LTDCPVRDSGNSRSEKAADELSVGSFKRDHSARMLERSALILMHGLPRRHFADQPTRFDVNSLNPNLMALPTAYT